MQNTIQHTEVNDLTGLPLVSIITINYNQSRLTASLLESLRAISYPNIEIFVVDNHSLDDNPLWLQSQFPEINLILNGDNLGFAGGNNIGIRKAKGKYILLLNNDTEVEKGFLEPLVDKLERDPGIGAVSPKIRFYHTPDTIQYAGYSPINTITMRGHGIGYAEKDLGQFDRDANTAYLHGAAMMVSRDVIQKVGMLAECYFLYYEELDWSQRIRNAGYQLCYVHNSLVFHKESMTTGKMSPLKTYYLNRARILFMRRNVKGLRYPVAVLYQIFIAIPRNGLKFLFDRKPGHFQAYRNAVYWHLRHLQSKNIHANPTF